MIISSVIVTNAQTNLIGKYHYKDPAKEGNPMNSTLEIKNKSAVVLTYVSVEDDYETKTRTGIWTYSKAGNLLTITLPVLTDNENKDDDRKQIYTLDNFPK